jgi:type IX secretion system PorP/SprF family membrane protein
MKRNITFLFLLFAVVTTAFGQQEAQFSQNMFNNMAINPAYAGMNNSICATLFDRMQWVGFKDPYNGNVWPKTQLLSVDGSVSPIHGGIGVTIMNDQLGLETNTDFKLAYSYHLAAGPGTLGIGAQVGFYNEKIDFSGFHPIDSGDPLLSSSSKQGNLAADMAFGLFYNIPNKLYFGISATQLLQSTVKYPAPLADLTLARNYYVSAGYYYPLPSNPSLEIDPSLLIKSDLSSTQFDINALLKYNNKFWGGLSWRPTDAVVIMIGMNVWQGLLVGYSYDITTSAMGADHRSSGSHEIMLHYCLKVLHETHPESYHNTRFL